MYCNGTVHITKECCFRQKSAAEFMVKDFRYAEDNVIGFFFSKSQEEMEVTNRQMTMTIIFAQLDTGHCVAYPRYAKIIFFIFSIPCDEFLTETKGV